MENNLLIGLNDNDTIGEDKNNKLKHKSDINIDQIK